MRAMSDIRRRQAERRGRASELFAAIALMLKGYRIIGRRVRTHRGEIDLIARAPNGVVCFIEVKARDAPREAQESLGSRQQARIVRAAELYLAQWPGLNAAGVRFDLITVSRRRWPAHIRDAWRAG